MSNIQPGIIFCTPCYLMADKQTMCDFIMEGTSLCGDCMDKIKKRAAEEKAKKKEKNNGS